MVAEYVARWSGARIGTGATVLHFEDPIGEGEPTATADAVRTWFNARAAALPNDVTVTFDPEMKVLNLDGSLSRVEGIDPPDPVTGTYAGNWANGSGRMVRLRTDAIAGNRRLQGRIYLVPSGGCVDLNGDIFPATISADQTAHNTFLSSQVANGMPLSVWSRTHAVAAPVTSISTVSRPATLRTRNDR